MQACYLRRGNVMFERCRTYYNWLMVHLQVPYPVLAVEIGLNTKHNLLVRFESSGTELQPVKPIVQHHAQLTIK
uniref:Uncharacterized protein n=1 Tax=Romanomermis culicivorax TaxID=13658 RepID=A0A915J0Z2_ROMCU